MSISLSKKSKPKPSRSNFGAQLVRRLINTAAKDIASMYKHDLDDACDTHHISCGPLPYIGVPVASEMTPAEISLAVSNGSDPWSEDLNGSEPPNACDLPISTLIAAMRFGQIVPTHADFKVLFAAGSLTFLAVPKATDLALLSDSMGELISEGSAITAAQADKRCGLRIITFDPRLAASSNKPAEYRAGFATRVDEAIGDGCAVLALANNVQLLSPDARIVLTQSLHWPAITQNSILKLLAQTHSMTGMIATDALKAILPPDAALNAMSATLLLHALQAPTTIDVAQRLASHAAATSGAASSNRLTLEDLKGVPHVTHQLEDIVADLKDWQRGRLNWDEINASILLAGPPGTGKTLAATALAGSAGIPLISTSFTNLQKYGHLGEYLRAMSNVVDEAISSAPSIIFFDELDSFGSRGGTGDRNERYWTSVINDFLQQLTRLNATPGVIVIAATNYVEKIDPAIIRSGRFDLKITVDHPDKDGVRNILAYHLGGASLVDLDVINQLIGLSGADLAFIARDAKSRARRAKSPLSQYHVRQAADAAAPAGDTANLKRIAGHEAGHIVIAGLLDLPLPVAAFATTAGGLVRRAAPSVFTAQSTKLELAYLFGGRAAEMLLFGNVSSGSGGQTGSDLDCATSLALSLETDWGLGDNGLMFAPLATYDRHAMSAPLRCAINKRLADAENMALSTLSANIDLLRCVTDALMQSRELNKAQIAELFVRPVVSLLTPPDQPSCAI